MEEYIKGSLDVRNNARPLDQSSHSVQCALCGVQCALCGVHCAVYTVRCTLCGVRCALYTVHCTGECEDGGGN